MLHDISYGLKILLEVKDPKTKDTLDKISSLLPGWESIDGETESKRLMPAFPKPPSSLPEFRGRWHGWKRGDGVMMAPSKFLVYDVETSRLGSQKKPICAVAWDGDHWYGWQPSPHLEDLIPLNSQGIICQNLPYDSQFTLGNCSGLDIMAICSMIHLGTESQLHIAQANAGVPWSRVAMPSMVSLKDLAKRFLYEELDKGTRDLCVENDYGTNLCDHLEEIINYCAKDVEVTARIGYQLIQKALVMCPNALYWFGQFVGTGFKVPVDPQFQDWFFSLERHIAESYREYEEALPGVISKWYTPFTPPEFPGGCFKTKKAEAEAKREHKAKVLRMAARHFRKQETKFSEWCRDGKNFCTTNLLDWGYTKSGENAFIPNWVLKVKAKGSNTVLPTLLGLKYGGKLVYYDYPRYPNVMRRDGDTSGSWCSKNVDNSLMECNSPDFDAISFIELGIASSIFTKFRERLEFIQISNISGTHWITPNIHWAGTVTGRCTDPLFHVAPNHNPKVPGSELMGLFLAPEGFVFIGGDWDQEEAMLMAAQADGSEGKLNSCPFSEAVNRGDIHNLNWELLPKKYINSRKKVKPVTFGVGYGMGIKGLMAYLESQGCPPSESKHYATNFINGFKGKRRGEYYYGGTASAYYNQLRKRVHGGGRLKTVLFGREFPLPLQPEYHGGEEGLTRENAVTQGTGADILRAHIGYVEILRRKYGVEVIPAMSIHDRIVWLCREEDALMASAIIQASHCLVVRDLYRALGLKEFPERFALLSGIDCAKRMIWTSDYRLPTPSNPDGFDGFYTNKPLVSKEDIKEAYAKV